MAKLPALIRALVPLDGREQTALELIARTVREAGFIATTKRGSGASEMTAADAASLLIGANAAQSLRAAPQAVRQFRALRRLGRPDGEAETMPNGTGHKLIRDAETFGEALEALIKHLPNLDFEFMGSVPNPPRQGFDYSDTGSITQPDIAVDFQSTPLARITITWDKRLFSSDPAGSFIYEYGSDQQASNPDRLITTRIGRATIQALENALHAGDELDLEA